MNIKTKVYNLFRLAIENDIEPVTYGLAPRPNGWCFENNGDKSQAFLDLLADKFEALNKDETKEMRHLVFGSK